MFVADGFWLFLILTDKCESNVKNRKDRYMHCVWRAFLFYPLFRSFPTPPLRILCISLSSSFASGFFLFFPSPLLPLTWFFFQLKNHVTKTSPSQPPSSSAVCIFNEATWLYRSANLLLSRPPLVCFRHSMQTCQLATDSLLFLFYFFIFFPITSSPSLLFFFFSIPTIWRLHVDMYIVHLVRL